MTAEFATSPLKARLHARLFKKNLLFNVNVKQKIDKQCKYYIYSKTCNAYVVLIVHSMKGEVWSNDIVTYLNEVWYSCINMRHIKGLYL